MNAQMPVVPEDIAIPGSLALTYADKIAAYIPAAKVSFSKISAVANCALQYGVVGAQAYITKDYKAGGVMVILSQGQLLAAPTVALQCFLDKIAKVTGGGPSGSTNQFAPCITQYYYDRTTLGVADRYYVLVVGTNQPSCPFLAAYHSIYSPKSFLAPASTN